MTRNRNVEVFNDPTVVAYYDHEKALHESERLLFETYLKEGMTILDIGVGAGRTTPYLSRIAARYVGVDYSDAMIAKCRTNFPTLSFLEIDAADMAVFPDGTFDAVVFSFNGIDCLPDDEARARCLRECARVLRCGGIFIVSSHNARYLFFTPVLAGVGTLKKAWRLAYAAAQTLLSLLPRIASMAFWRKAGYVRDTLSRGRPVIYVSTPDRFSAELLRSNFRVARIVGAHYPRVRPTPAVPWYYYACVKNDPREARIG
jgi:ubiquinone/menaquinone biosynthesis C-methylase UbiE